MALATPPQAQAGKSLEGGKQVKGRGASGTARLRTLQLGYTAANRSASFVTLEWHRVVYTYRAG
jgi:hypothetical protein